jgi:HEAT repeat protein
MGLGKIPSAVAMEHLVLMLTDEDSRVRTVAATVLGRVGGESSFGPLLAALRDEEPDVVCATLRSLEGQGERAFAPVLERVRRSRGLVLLAAMESLSRIDSLRAGTVLTEFLGDDDSEVVVTALRLLADQGGAPWLQRYGEGLCSHLHWEVRAEVAEILGSLPAAEGRERLEKMRACEDDPLVLRRIHDSLEGCR